MANNRKPSVAVARSTRSSTTKSSKSPATTAASSAKPSTKAQRSVKSSATTSASKVSPTPPASGLIGPRAAEYLKAQLAEEKRKKVIREKAKAAKASEKEDFSDEEANDRASSPPITSDVEVDEDEEEFNNIYGEEHTPEEQPLEHLEDGQEEEDHALEGFQDMEVDVDTPDNGIDLVKTPTKASTPFSSPSKRVSVQAAVARTKLRHQLNVSPSRTYSRPSPDKRKVYKVTSNMFSPRTRKLAVAGKHHARRVSTIEDAFPSDKHAFFLDIARQTAVVESLVDVFESVKEDTDVQKLLTSFMGYARGGLFTSLAKKAREFTASYYSLPGTRKASEVKDMVDWLVSDGHFKYGGVNVENRTFDTKKPFEAEGIAHLLRLEYFATKGGANIAVFKEMVAAKRIKGPTIALMITVLEHALMEYSDGTYCNSEFTDSAQTRYYHHLSSYKRIAEGAPTWADRFEARLFNLVLNQSNKTFLLDVEANDMNEVDIAELEASAVADSNTASVSSSTEA
ncbi:hypothetical protein F5880DRAFT_1616979 [Lentinula raphanica]|nr:hypothetical protein F5880DRAFT_1616979 [Lentinula raphanica]